MVTYVLVAINVLVYLGELARPDIVLNMLGLWTLGRVVEEVLGRLRFLALYLLSALGGSVMGYLVSPGDSAVGASGAIFGLAAAYFVISRRLNRDPGGATRLVVIFIVWMVVSAGVTPWEGHLGGLLTGGAVALAYAYAPMKRRTVVHLGVSVAMLVMMVALVGLKTSELTSAV
jgi:membrane associated rhomboid family serine protease